MDSFKNGYPIILEPLWKGEYATGLASLYPEKNFSEIGVDVKTGCTLVQKAIDHKQANVAFLRTQSNDQPVFLLWVKWVKSG